MMPGGMMGGPGWWGPGYGVFGWLWMLLFWILIIAGAVLIVRWLTAQAGLRASASEETALDILKMRYAKGDISKEEFERMKADLR